MRVACLSAVGNGRVMEGDDSAASGRRKRDVDLTSKPG